MSALKPKNIWCVECNKDVPARIIYGDEVYPHRKDLHKLAFWKCDDCGNFVGCHKDSGYKPLGCIANKELKNARSHIHRILDPLWKSKKMKRSAIYKRLSDSLGFQYHTAEIRSVEEARKVCRLVEAIRVEG